MLQSQQSPPSDSEESSSDTRGPANNEEKDRKPTDFSIDSILQKNDRSANNRDVFSWLQCTRYCPPKIPRSHRKEGPQKRQLGRHPRIPFTSQQLSQLEAKYQQTPYLSSEEVTEVSHRLDLADVRVKIWFQNRRARERREKSAAAPQRVSPKSGESSTRTQIEVTDRAEDSPATVISPVHQPKVGIYNFPEPGSFTPFVSAPYFGRVGFGLKPPEFMASQDSCNKME